MKKKIIKFHNINFYNTNINNIYKLIMKGGYLVAPAASALAKIKENKYYHNALIDSNIAIFDSGFFCILLRIFKNQTVKKLSGYKFLKYFINKKEIKKKKILLVDPSSKESLINKKYLQSKNFTKIKNYQAPIYSNEKIKDYKLLIQIKKYKPKIIIINIGGGTQEILAKFLYEKVNHKVTIICTGAAIGFLTGTQAPINTFIDKIYFGWLLRIIYNPQQFFLRTLKSFNLIKLFI